eukprot:TRINITY_DN43158_c0_g1_i1.p1 TRINITY_DN43158_c0_g1~~TRINITY_DN43158_c0_g1_i1.p1  ORF type:complete len:686 (+),score=79.96 TRINITY_DN43158_c0_g1_i1:70-2127(+)
MRFMLADATVVLCSVGLLTGVAGDSATRQNLYTAFVRGATSIHHFAGTPPDQDACGGCDGWRDSLLLGKLTRVWEIVRWLSVNKTLVDLGPTLETIFGESLFETTLLGEAFYAEFSRIRFPCNISEHKECPSFGSTKVMAVAVWSNLVFSESFPEAFINYGGDCAPIWASIELLLAFRFSHFAEVLWAAGGSKSSQFVSELSTVAGLPTFYRKSSDLGLALSYANAFVDKAIHDILLCDASVLPKAPVHREEVLLNVVPWARSYGSTEPHWWSRWHPSFPNSCHCPPEEPEESSEFSVRRTLSSHRGHIELAERSSDGAPDAAKSVSPRRPRRRYYSTVGCLIPAVWPFEAALMKEIADTYGVHCDRCFFLVALPDHGRQGSFTEAPDAIGACKVVDLRAAFSSIVADDWNVKNILQKVSHGLEYAGSILPAFDWACLVETDVYFSPVNFRRLVRTRLLSPEDLHWLGYTHMHSLLEEGIMVEPATGSCLSRAALLAAVPVLRVARRPHGGGVFSHVQQDADRPSVADPVVGPPWPPDSQVCDPLKHGVHDLLTPIVNACLRLAKIYPPPPELVHDNRGRLYFPNIPWNENVSAFQPPRSPIDRMSHSHILERKIWKGREHLYASCQHSNPDGWVARYPVMFHGHVTHDNAYQAPSHSSWKLVNPSLRQVHARLMWSDFRFGPWS